MPKLSKKEKLLEEHKEELKGKHVIVAGGKIYSAVRKKKVEKLLEEVRKKYPNETPLYTYIPAEDSLILCL